MAGFGAKNYKDGHFIDIKSLLEHRGISYGIGADDGAITVPNFIKKYNPKLKGGSVSKHLVEICYGPICPPFQCKFIFPDLTFDCQLRLLNHYFSLKSDRPLKDRLNAAQSAGMAMNLDHELDYLIPGKQCVIYLILKCIV